MKYGSFKYGQYVYGIAELISYYRERLGEPPTEKQVKSK
jgi:hypothetical protein